MKKLLSVLLSLALVVAALPLSMLPANALVSGDFDYVVVDGKAVITYYGGTSTSIAFPSSIGGYPVDEISIDGGAHTYPDELEQVTEVIIPSGVTKIGSYCFGGCVSLANVTIPSTVSYIGDNAFNDTAWFSNLSDVYNIFGDGILVKAVGSSAVFNLSDYSNVKMIGSGAFAYNATVSSVLLPSSVTHIMYGAFSGCTNLSTLVIPSSVVHVGASVFKNTPWFNAQSGFVIVGDGVLCGYNGASTVLTVPETVKCVAESAFYDNRTISSVTFTAPVKIDDNAFYNCTALSTLSMAEGASVIGTRAFYSCDLLASVELPEGVSSVGNYAFASCPLLASAVLPSTLKEIPKAMFDSCTSLAQCTIPEGVTNIGVQAFSSCDLTGIRVPSSMKRISSWAFSGCASLAELTLAYGLEIIESMAFENCTALTSVSIPGSVTAIGALAFSNCTSLKTYNVYCANTVFIGQNAFGYKVLSNTYVALDGVTVSCFEGCQADSFASAESSFTKTLLTPAGSSAYWSLTDDKLTVYGTGDCTAWSSSSAVAWYSQKGNFTEAEFLSGITSVGNRAFYGYSMLRKIKLPEGMTKIGARAFYGCSAIESFELPSTLKTIETYSFTNCSELTYMVLPPSVTSVALYAFTGCPKLLDMYISNTGTATYNPRCFGFSAASSSAPVSGFTIYGAVGSSAETYAGSNDIAFVPFDGTCGKNAYYGIDGTNLNIFGFGETDDYSAYSATPWQASANGVMSVTVGDKITGVGKNAFSGIAGLEFILVKSDATVLGLSCLPAGTAIVAATQSAAQLYSNINGNTLHDIANTYVADGAYASEPVFVTVGTGVASSAVNSLSLTDGTTVAECEPAGLYTLADGTFGLYTYGDYVPGTLTVGDTDCTIVCSHDGIYSVNHNYTLSSHGDATCTQAGSDTYTCSDCAVFYSDEIPALGHDWSALNGVCVRCSEKCVHGGAEDGVCDICGATVYAVKFMDYLGASTSLSISKTELVVSGNGATAPDSIRSGNYIFTGWDESFATVTSDITVNAVYGGLYIYPTGGGTCVRGTDYTYENGVLTVLGSGEYTVRSAGSTSDLSPTGDTLAVASNASPTLTLYNLYIYSASGCALKVNAGSGNVNIIADSDVKLQSGSGRAGIEFNSDCTGKLTVDCVSNYANQKFNITGGSEAAGIGGAKNCGSGDIEFIKAVARVTGGSYAPAVGAGRYGVVTNSVTVQNGTYNFYSGSNSIPAINAAEIIINGGNVFTSDNSMSFKAQLPVTPQNSAGTSLRACDVDSGITSSVTFIKVEALGISSSLGSYAYGAANMRIYSDLDIGSDVTTDGHLYLWLPEGCEVDTVETQSTDANIICHATDGTAASYAHTPVNGVCSSCGDAIMCTVTFLNIDGTVIDTVKIQANTAITRPSDDPAYLDRVFLGWDNDFTTPITADTEVYAKYRQLAVSEAEGGTGYTYTLTSALPHGVVTITQSGTYTISNVTGSGSFATDCIEVADGVSATIILNGVNINMTNYAAPAIKLADLSAGNVTVVAADGTDNMLVGGSGCAAIQKNGAGTGILTVTGGSLGTGILVANGGPDGAGIGGSDGSDTVNITVAGGVIAANGGPYAAGIGGGNGGSGATLRVTGGTLTATGGTDSAGIGGGNGKGAQNIIIDGGTVTATGISGGAGIGGGTLGNGNIIVINGGNVTAYGGGETYRGGAGIGGGDGGYGNITINGGTVNATGGSGFTAYSGCGGGTGIGNGCYSNSALIGSVTINGGIVTATGGSQGGAYGGSGIGGGSGTSVDGINNSVVTISGGTVVATGVDGGAGIKGGTDMSSVTITGGSVKAAGFVKIDNAVDEQVSPYINTAYCSEVKVYLGEASAKVSALKMTPDSGYYYGFKDVYTDSEGYLYTYISKNAYLNSVTVNGVKRQIRCRHSGECGIEHTYDGNGVCGDCGDILYTVTFTNALTSVCYAGADGGVNLPSRVSGCYIFTTTDNLGAQTLWHNSGVVSSVSVKAYDAEYRTAVPELTSRAALLQLLGITEDDVTCIETRNGYCGTGTEIIYNDGDGDVAYKVVVEGDLNGDSVCDALDVMIARLMAGNQYTPDDRVYSMAGDSDGDLIISDEEIDELIDKSIR